jgi:hypothetical protein
LLGKSDSGGFNSANPDRKEPGTIDFLKQDYRLIGRHLDANADNLHRDQHEQYLSLKD